MNEKLSYANRPLVQQLIKFLESSPISLHVPGHKNGVLSGLPSDLRLALRYDLTELEDLDDLHEPEGVLKDAMERLTLFYGSDRSFFLINGSTVGNLAMIYASCSKGDVVIVQRNAHKSIFHAIELTGATAILVSPPWDSESRTMGTVRGTQIRKAVKEYPESKAVILTYPTYYGVTGIELEEIIAFCHSQDIPVLVDEAHGAHFVVGEPFPRSALDLGADVVVHSAHKTLPAMTMASFLHVKSKLLSSERVAHYLGMLQSSSPSYLLMASLDDARAYAESFNEEDKLNFIKHRSNFIIKLKEIPLLTVIEMDDPLKLLIRANDYSGFDLQKHLNKEGLYSELADIDQVLFILPLLKEGIEFPFEEICTKIQRAFSKLNETKKVGVGKKSMPLDKEISKLNFSFNEVKNYKTEWIAYEDAVGEILASSIIPYPPGIPLLLGGEKVTKDHVNSLVAFDKSGAKFQGAIRLSEKQVLVVKREVEE